MIQSCSMSYDNFLFLLSQTKAILAISEYVKKNPRASKAEVTKFVSDEIVNFAATVDSL